VEAPAFTLDTLGGRRFALTDLRGRVVLLNFWATWCHACREEMPSLERLQRRLGERGLSVVAVAVDRGSARGVRRFTAGYGVSFPVPLDPEGRVRRAYEVTALPLSYIIGRDGRIIGRVFGARKWDEVEAVRFLEEVLGGLP